MITIQNLSFSYSTPSPFSLQIPFAEFKKNSRIFIDGPSGCGKTTYLNLITGLMSPDSGDITILDTSLSQLSPSQKDQFRADHFGIIFQQFNLIPYLSVIENIILSCTFSTIKKDRVLNSSPSLDNEANRLCHRLELDSLIDRPVNELSIGQQQRVAIARALIGQPEIIVADEPTSALDTSRKHQFMSLLMDECRQYQSTLIFVSHDTGLASDFDQVIHLDTRSTHQREALVSV